MRKTALWLATFALLAGLVPAVGAGAVAGFSDVPADAYYAPAVDWLVDQGITTGTTATTFSPANPVTRGQMAAFLWRFGGEQPADVPGFSDVPADAYYAVAVGWLLSLGITTGTSATTYSPNNPVTRGQMAAFLWRYAGQPVGSPGSPFTDVPVGAYYESAVDWLVDEGITTGTSKTTFSPGAVVTRGQMAAFLWRFAGEPKVGETGENRTPVPTVKPVPVPNPGPDPGTGPGPGPDPEPVIEYTVEMALLPGTEASTSVDVGDDALIDAVVVDDGGTVAMTVAPSGTDLYLEVTAPLAVTPGTVTFVTSAVSCTVATDPCPADALHDTLVQVDVAVGEPGVEVPGDILMQAEERWVADDDGIESVPGERVVLAIDGTTVAEMIALAAPVGGIVVGADEGIGMFQLRFASEVEAAAAQPVLASSPLITLISPYRAFPDILTQLPVGDWDDDGPEKKWTFNVTGTPGAWDRETGTASTHIGVIDDGIYYLHEDLYFNYAPNYSYETGEGSKEANWTTKHSNGSIRDHGTHVAGTICADQNGTGLVGVMWECTLDLLDLATYKHDAAYHRSRIGKWLDDHPEVRIINMSWGFGAHPSKGCTELSGDDHWVTETWMADLFDAYRDRLFVVAAGNCGTSNHDPALDIDTLVPASLGPDFVNVVTVASHDRDGGLSGFSNTGAEVAAPGGYYHDDAEDALDTKVWSTTHDCDANRNCHSTYGQKSGTSMAAPFITGVAGLMLSHRPGLSVAELAACITGPGSPYPVPGATDLTAIAVDSALDCAEGDTSASGSIEGTVTEEGTGTPLVGITVEVLEEGGGAVIGDADTAADGTYTVTGLDAGVYDVHVFDSSGTYNGQWINGVTVPQDGVITVDAQLSPAATTFTTCAAQDSIPTIECEALVALYNSTDGPNWGAEGWLTDPDPCAWHRVVCIGAAVTGLNLGIGGLLGSIPSEIGNLANLEWLDLESNQLSGSIPPEIGNLTKLTDLYLEGNDLSGPIPPEIGNLTNLGWFGASENQLEGPLPPEFGNLASLWDVGLWDNQLSGPIPPELGNLTNLTSLQLGNYDPAPPNNQLSGPIPPELGNLTNLGTLTINDNQLSGPIPVEFGNLSELRQLWLGGNELSGPILSELGSLGHLWRLYLDDNQLSGPIPPELGNLVRMDDLRLSRNHLSGPIPPELGNLTNLRYLWLNNNQLSGEVPLELQNVPDLWELQLYGQTACLTAADPVFAGWLTNEDPYWNDGCWTTNGLLATSAYSDSGYGDIWVMDPDGSSPINLTASWDDRDSQPSNEQFPVWSPSGTQIALTSTRGTAGSPFQQAVWVMDFDGSDPRRITSPTDTPGEDTDWWPSWSPDGEWIIFSRGYEGLGPVYKVRADGTEESLMLEVDAATGEHGINSPRWASDGSLIAYASETLEQERGVVTIGPDGTGRTTLTPGYWARNPYWSPDASRIVYDRCAEATPCDSGVIDVRIMNRDGSGDSLFASDGFEPVWSPDGTTILYNRWIDDGGAGTLKLFSAPASGGAASEIPIPFQDSVLVVYPEWDWQPVLGAP